MITTNLTSAMPAVTAARGEGLRRITRLTVSVGELQQFQAELFAEVHRGRKVRLLGIYASQFGEEKPQLALFEEPGASPSPVDTVRDVIAKRFGDEAITRASLLGRRERRNPSDKPPR